MIQANEIRLGNYFSHNDKWNTYGHEGIFQWSDSDWYSLGECTLFLENISPVMLTEEILLKCGFYKCESKFIGKPDILSIQISNIDTLDYEEDEFFIANCAWNPVFTFWESPKYLHTLQNLFYSLTGGELEVSWS